MSIKNYFIAGFIALILTVFTSQVFAVGIGVYGTFSKGKVDNTVTNDDTDYEFDDNYDSVKGGLGFILDTTLAFDRLFNYRLQVGYERVKFDNTDFNRSISGYEFHFYNTFGFGVLRSELIRLWLGPQVGFGWTKGEYEFSGGYDPDPNSYLSFFGSLGLVAGINFNFGDSFTLGLDAGYRIDRHFGESKIGKDMYGDDYVYSFTGKGKEVFFDICFVFRIDDRFQ